MCPHAIRRKDRSYESSKSSSKSTAHSSRSKYRNESAVESSELTAHASRRQDGSKESSSELTAHASRRQDGNESAVDSLKFTAHAAALLQRGHENSAYGCQDSAATDNPLLDDLNHEDGEQLKRLIRQTFPACNVDHIHRVNSPQMYGMYLLRNEEIRLTNGGDGGEELMLYHVTTKSRALESLERGLDWRRTRRSKFGCGVSFSDDADYANYYASQSSLEDTRVIVVCAMTVKNTYRVRLTGRHKVRNLIIPPNMDDTSTSSSRRVYVKYNDYDFYPLYFMYYQRTPELRNESKYFKLKQSPPKWLQRRDQRHREQREQRRRDRRQREQAQREQSQGEQARRERRHREQSSREQSSRERHREQSSRERHREQSSRERHREQSSRERRHREQERRDQSQLRQLLREPELRGRHREQPARR